MGELFNYDTSWLNPALKLVIAGIYVFVAYIYFRARRFYAGDLHKVLSLLFWTGAAAAVAAFLRYLGHGTQFGFTKEFSLKWFQSLGYVVQAVLFVVAGWWFGKDIIPEIRQD
jgi:hypothetical protein